MNYKELTEIIECYEKEECKECSKCPMYSSRKKCIVKSMREDWPKWSRELSNRFWEKINERV